MKANRLLVRKFLETDPEEGARILERAPIAGAARILGEVSPGAAAAVLQRMSPPAEAACWTRLDGEAAQAIAAALPVQAAAALLRRIEPEDRERFLGDLTESSRDRLRSLLHHPEGTAGALLDPSVPVLPDDLTHRQAVDRVRQFAAVSDSHLFVVDRSRAVRGYLRVGDLMSLPSDRPIAKMLDVDFETVSPAASLASLLTHRGWERFDILPVSTHQGVFLGGIRHRDLRRLARSALDGRQGPSGRDLAFSLMEFYCVGLSRLFEGIASVVSTHGKN